MVGLGDNCTTGDRMEYVEERIRRAIRLCSQSGKPTSRGNIWAASNLWRGISSKERNASLDDMVERGDIRVDLDEKNNQLFALNR
jgi:hypothetical protein